MSPFERCEQCSEPVEVKNPTDDVSALIAIIKKHDDKMMLTDMMDLAARGELSSFIHFLISKSFRNGMLLGATVGLITVLLGFIVSRAL